MLWPGTIEKHALVLRNNDYHVYPNTRRIGILSRELTLRRLFHLPSEEGLSKRKELVSYRDKFFSVRVDLFSEMDWCTGSQTGSHKGSLHLNIAENYQACTVPLNLFHREPSLMEKVSSAIVNHTQQQRKY